MAKKATNSNDAWAPTTAQLNMLVVSYVAARLAFVNHPEAWSRKSRNALKRFLLDLGAGGGYPTPIPPPPPRKPMEAFLNDLQMNLEHPKRGDLPVWVEPAATPAARTRKSRTRRPRTLLARTASTESMIPSTAGQAQTLSRI